MHTRSLCTRPMRNEKYMSTLLSERIASDGITITTEHTGERMEGNIQRADWKVTFKRRGARPMTVPKFTCQPGAEPTALDVLDCLVSDASSYENEDGYEAWASQFSSDPEEWMPRSTYNAVAQQSEKLKKWLGDELYNDYLFETDSDA